MSRGSSPYQLRQLSAMVVPVQSGLKIQRKTINAALREVHSYASMFGTIKRFFGKLEERRVVHTLTMLPRLADALVGELQDKTEHFSDLREQQRRYVGTLNTKIGGLLEARETPLPHPLDYSSLLEWRAQKDERGLCKAYGEFLDRLVDDGEQYLQRQLGDEAFDEYHQFRDEALLQLMGCRYVHKNLTLITDAMERRVNHLHQVLGMHREIILLGRDLLSARRGLKEIIERGEQISSTIQESYLRLEGVMKDLKEPSRLLLSSS